MLRSFKDDLKYGLDREDEVNLKLIKQFEEDIKNTKELYNNPYYKYDYEGMVSGTRYELKCRKNEKYKYNTTIIPCHKINKLTTEKDLYFVFNFTNGITYIKYDKNLFDTFKIKTIKIFRAGKYDPPTDHYEIPINLLIDF
jgi:hypothetical protein